MVLVLLGCGRRKSIFNTHRMPGVRGSKSKGVSIYGEFPRVAVKAYHNAVCVLRPCKSGALGCIGISVNPDKSSSIGSLDSSGSSEALGVC